MPLKVSKKRKKGEVAAAEEALRADLECPVCFNTAFPPVKQVRFPQTHPYAPCTLLTRSHLLRSAQTGISFAIRARRSQSAGIAPRAEQK